MFSAKRTEADYQVRRDPRDGMARKYAMQERGERFRSPTVDASSPKLYCYFGYVCALARGFVQLAAHDQVQLVIVQLNRCRLVAGLLQDNLVFRLMLAHDVDPQIERRSLMMTATYIDDGRFSVTILTRKQDPLRRTNQWL
jgi:hypothetical protein